MTYDSPADNSKFTRKHDIAFPILTDEQSEHIRRFGLLNETIDPATRYFGVPHPGIFIISPAGKVVAKLAEENYRDRPTVAAVLEAVDQRLLND